LTLVGTPSHALHWRDFDDVVEVLNVVRASDLTAILRLTPARLRPSVAMAFADIGQQAWANYAGLEAGTVHRWLSKENRLTFGGAFRLAKVLGGVDVMVLFADWID